MVDDNINTPLLKVYKTYQESILNNTEDWKHLITEDILFKSPLVQLKGKKHFIQFHEFRYKALIKRVLNKIAVCDNYVITISSITFRLQNREPITVQATEWYTFQEGKISALESFGDPSILSNDKENIFSPSK